MIAGACVITGGAGFIGCALSAGVVRRFERVIVLDNLHPQIHAEPIRPAALHPAVEFRRADATDPTTWDGLLEEVCPHLIVHLAAETGTGQSLTEASRHAHVNVLGTTVMLDALSRHGCVPGQIVLSSSRAIYGEGAWRRQDGTMWYPGQRGRDQLLRGDWEFAEAEHVPSSSAATEAHPTSIYGATKLAQEHLLQAWAMAFGAKLSILRLQNVYGPGQSLVNSYTGVVALFARLAREGKSIPLYEDGLMQRDFVYIDDVAAAFLTTIDAEPAGTIRGDIGVGKAVTINQVAEFMAQRYDAPEPHVSGGYRHGDVRHASCDISHTTSLLPWIPQWSLDQGLEALCVWIDGQLPTITRRLEDGNASVPA